MNTLTHQSLQCFELLTRFLQQLPADAYQQSYPSFYGGTIGKHVRHILEFYQQLLGDSAAACVNYDARERQTALESSPQHALDRIDYLVRVLATPLQDRPLTINAAVFEDAAPVASSFHRELFYAYEHMVHHMALIKVGCFGVKDLHFSENFGLAYATAQHQQATCAQ